MRQRLTLVLTCSMHTRRRAIRRLAAFWVRVRARPRGFRVGMIVSTWFRVKARKPQILEQPTARRQGIGSRLGNPLIVGAASRGLTEKEARECRLDQQDGFDRVVLLLAARTPRLLSRILGALDAPCGAIVATRGEAGAGAGVAAGRAAVGGEPAVGTTMAATSASATPRRCANAVKDRVGASPSACSVARRTTRRT